MSVSNLRKVGGSVMLAVPPALLERLDLKPGAKVGLTVQSGRLVVQPMRRPRYTLKELLAESRPQRKRTGQERQWLNSGAAGRELI